MPDLNWTDDQKRVMGIFQPHAAERLLDASTSDRRFVHYTSAETAAKILETKAVLLRQASAMNDFREIEYGITCISEAWTRHRALFDQALSPFDHDFGPRLWEWFVSWRDRIRWESFVACISEHDADEDTIGRLSMWRAYASRDGVALVLNATPFLTASDALGAYSSPVAYHSIDSFCGEFEALLFRIRADLDYLKSKPEGWVFGEMCHVLHFAMLCTKHAGFREEREWRVVRSPAFNKPTTLQESVRVIRGVPQTVLSLELKDNPEAGLTGIEIPSLLNRVIIGPSQQPIPIASALVSLLRSAGISDPLSRMAVSDIPLRT